MMINDSLNVEELFWVFFTIATSILSVWISLLFRSQKTLASKILIVTAIIDAPVAIFNTTYWNLWPAGSLFSQWVDFDPFAEPEPLLAKIETVTSNLSTLLFMIWLVALLFVGFRFRLEQRRVREMQSILTQQAQGGSPAE